MFYAGLSAMSAAQGDGLEQVPEVTRDILVDGIPVTVTDTVDGAAFGGGEAAEGGAGGGVRPRFTVEVLDAAEAAGVPDSSAAAPAAEEQQQREAEPVGS